MAAPCPVYPACGGCQWQHIAYPAQFDAKVAIVRRALERFGDVPFNPWPAPGTTGYRRRARLAWEARDTLAFGFRGRQSDRIVDTTACLQLTPSLDQALVQLRRLLAGFGRSTGEAELLANHRGEVHVTLRVPRRSAPEAAALPVQWHQAFAGIEIAVGDERHLHGAETIELDERGLRAHAGVFTQANAVQDQVLRRCVAAALGATDARNVLEFHAGIGNFSVDLAPGLDHYTAVEANPRAADLLRSNTSALGVASHCADAESFVWEGKPACVLLDPPREGAATLSARLAGARIAHIIYVSCDPMTLARDLAILTEARYRLKSVDIVDMMPQTYHIETVCLLSRRSPRP